MNRPHSVICCWKCEPHLRDIWRLVASFGIDADGYQSTAGKIKKNLTPIIDTRRPWLDWTHKRIKRTDDLTAIRERLIDPEDLARALLLVDGAAPDPAAGRRYYEKHSWARIAEKFLEIAKRRGIA